MKFNDGFWLLKNGVKPFFGLQVTRVLEEPDGYTLHVSTRPIRHRGDTLGGSSLIAGVPADESDPLSRSRSYRQSTFPYGRRSGS